MDEHDAEYAPKSPELTPIDSHDQGEPSVLHPQHQQYRRSAGSIQIPLTPGGEHILSSPWSTTPIQYTPNPQQSPHAFIYPPHSAMGRRAAKREFDDEEDYSPARTKREAVENGSSAPINPADIEVKTKFPVARIKRIMQADEEVGKVAQVTPVAVCKYHPPH